MTEVNFPSMRREVMRSLASLADPQFQRRTWLDATSAEDLTMNINVLYDDTEVLPQPHTRIGSVLVAGDEVEALSALAEALDLLMDRLKNSGDSSYLAAEEWPDVCRLASVALAAMVRSGVF